MSEQTTEDRSALKRVMRDPVSRRRFLALTGGTGAAGAFLAACGSGDSSTSSSTTTDTSTSSGTTDSGGDPLAAFGKGDLGIVNYALTLEYLEAGFYAAVAKSGLFKGDSLALIKLFGQHEQDHVDALTATAKKLGGKPAPEPKANFPLKDAKSVLELAATVENLGASAYLGQAGAIENPDVLAAALSIHTIEARHAATLNVLTKQKPTPDGAFAKPADAKTVLDQVQPFLA